MPAAIAKLCYPLAGGLAAPARGDGTARGRFARALGLARNPIRAGLSALIAVMLVYHHLATTRNTGARRRRSSPATIVLAGLRAIRAMAQVESGNYAAFRIRVLCRDHQGAPLARRRYVGMSHARPLHPQGRRLRTVVLGLQVAGE